ncbi:cyclophilin-like fold protein [Cloacibacillus porcorum]
MRGIAEAEAGRQIIISAGGRSFSATLYDNEAAGALAAMLPMRLEMSELNGNEKYCGLSHSLPVNPARPSGIHAGDLMLYGSDCLVLFYKSFSTTYSYTPLGRIDDPAGLAEALSGGKALVSFQSARE